MNQRPTDPADGGLRGRMSIRSKLRVGLLLAAAVFCGPAESAQGDASRPAGVWHKVETEPYRLNNKQDAIAFANANLGLYGNGTGRIYRTLDGGLHWRLAWRKPGTYVRALEFADDQTAFMGNVGPGYFPDVSDRNPLYETHDAGSTWEPVVAGIESSGGRPLCASTCSSGTARSLPSGPAVGSGDRPR